MNILIIEDDRLTQHSLSHILKGAGHTVQVAGKAQEAIDLISKKSFDVILSDIMMPGVSGLSLISLLRTKHQCTTPIIVMSVLNNSPLLEAAYSAGANDFINKPIDPDDLLKKVNKYPASKNNIQNGQ